MQFVPLLLIRCAFNAGSSHGKRSDRLSMSMRLESTAAPLGWYDEHWHLPAYFQSPSLTHAAIKYHTSSYRKHKRSDGWGTLCPSMSHDEAQKLLQGSVSAGNARYNVCDDYCYKSFCHATE